MERWLHTSPEYRTTRVNRFREGSRVEKRNKLINRIGGKTMGYGIAWLLGVPVSVLVIWYVVTHVL